MKIAVIGASRGIGLAVVRMALQRGHEVTALLRDPSKMPLSDRKLMTCTGDILSASSVEEALAGQDAVCTAIGVPPSRKPIRTFSQGAINVLMAIEHAPNIMWIAVTGIGAGDSRGHGGFFYDKILQPLLLKEMYLDKDREEAVLRASSVNWMIVRPGMLTNGDWTGRYRVLTDLASVTAGKISRVDVADFIVNQFEKPMYLRQSPLLTY